MSGGFRGSNGPGATDGTGPAGVMSRIRREQRDSRSTGRPSLRAVDFPIPSAIALDASLAVTVPLDPPFRDDAFLVTAEVVDSANTGALTAIAAVLTYAPDSVYVSIRAVKAVPAGALLKVRAIHP